MAQQEGSNSVLQSLQGRLKDPWGSAACLQSLLARDAQTLQQLCSSELTQADDLVVARLLLCPLFANTKQRNQYSKEFAELLANTEYFADPWVQAIRASVNYEQGTLDVKALEAANASVRGLGIQSGGVYVCACPACRQCHALSHLRTA